MSYAVLGESSERNLRSVPSASDDDDLHNSRSGGGTSLQDEERRSSLSEPLTANGNASNEDPFYVFREDLFQKLDQVDEALADYLRIIHQTVRHFFCFRSCRRRLVGKTCTHSIVVKELTMILESSSAPLPFPRHVQLRILRSIHTNGKKPRKS